MVAKNGKTQICFYLLNRAILSKFSTHRLSEKCTIGNFQKIFLSPKMAAILNFQIFAKNGKKKFPSISLTVQIERFRRKFRSKHCTYVNFQKNFLSPKMAAILNFKFLPKMQKHKFASISLTVRDRAISSKFSTHRISQQSTLANFVQVLEQNSCSTLGGHYACQCVLFLVLFYCVFYILCNIFVIVMIFQTKYDGKNELLKYNWIRRLSQSLGFIIVYPSGP